ncbi:MAG: isoprenyl transferase [Candidatus Eisenbacteria bacterium]|nr:isoprenyl transferase [Candidatus Eisenbacteria bacterium]
MRSRRARRPSDAGGALNPAGLPGHVAVIMDGNGRWARRRGLPRVAGHAAAREAVRSVVTAGAELGLRYLTLYTFSMENWERPRAEVAALMRLLDQTLAEQADEMDRNNIRLAAIGRLDALPKYVQSRLQRTIERLARNDGLTLTLALSYGGRTEILDAVRAIAEAARRGELEPASLDERAFRDFLCAPGLPDPDLLIRTSGELRVSNFLLWQIAYTEIYVTDTLWPDFRKADLLAAIADYQRRERRFGRVAGRSGGR